MILAKTSNTHKYLCGLKIGIIIVAFVSLLGESWLNLGIMLIVGQCVVFLQETKKFEINDRYLLVYRIDKFDRDKIIYRIDRNAISELILKFPTLHCASKIIIKQNDNIALTISGFEMPKSDFYNLLDSLKQNVKFNVETTF